MGEELVVRKKAEDGDRLSSVWMGAGVKWGTSGVGVRASVVHCVY